jgi:hypothetical protein
LTQKKSLKILLNIPMTSRRKSKRVTILSPPGESLENLDYDDEEEDEEEREEEDFIPLRSVNPFDLVGHSL